MSTDTLVADVQVDSTLIRQHQDAITAAGRRRRASLLALAESNGWSAKQVADATGLGFSWVRGELTRARGERR